MGKKIKVRGISRNFEVDAKNILILTEENVKSIDWSRPLIIGRILQNEEVEIIEEEPEIDIQSIEGIEVEVISQCDNWLQDKNEEITAEINPYIIDCIRKNTLNFHNKINELIQAVKKLDNQINNK